MSSPSPIVRFFQTRVRGDGIRFALMLAVLLFFLVSGACGLLYQVVWTRSLVLLFGTTSYAVSTVLSIFFLGLGLGSLLGGRIADRSRRPLLWYGLFEIAIGAWALLFILLIGWGESVVVDLLRATTSSRGTGIALRALLAAVFLIVPVTLMGTTLPLLARAIIREGQSRGLKLGLLYGINTLGAVTGCALTGFVLIQQLGYTQTTFIGVAANLAVGVLALLLSLRKTAGAAFAESHAPETSGAQTESAGAADRLATAVAVFAFAMSGFCTLALEVLWTRLLSIVFTGTTYAYTTMLTSLLCGIALGSLVASFYADRRKHPVSWFGAIQILAGLSCLYMLTAFANMPEQFSELRLTSHFDFDRMVRISFILCFTALFVPTFLFGMAFPFAVRSATRIPTRLGRDIGRLYGVNTFAGVVGSVAGGYFILPLLGAHRGIVVLGLLLAATGLLLVLACPTRGRIGKGVILAFGVVLLAITWRVLPDDAGYALNKRFLPEDHKVIHYKEGVEGTVVVSEPKDNTTESNRVLWINSVQATQSIEKGVKMNRFQGVLPLLFDRQPKNALFMCFGSGVTAGTLALSDFERIDAVEISRDVLDAAPLFAADNLGVLQNPKVNFVVDDGRNFLLTTKNQYDLITFEPMPLAVAGVSTFYTREFYEQCIVHLAPGGLVSQWVPLHSLDIDVVRSLVFTFRSVFPEYCMWFINADLFLVGSNQPLTVDYANAMKTYANPEIGPRLQAAGMGDLTELLSCFFMGKESMTAFSEGGNLMVDDRPWAEFVAPKLMFDSTVDISLETLKPFYASPLDMLAFTGIPEAEAEAARTALALRHEAHKVTLEGEMLLYRGLVGESQEDKFMAALDVDPHDYTALFYLEDIAVQRMGLFIRWQELDNARAYLTKMQPYLGEEAAYALMEADILFAEEKREEAAQAYRRYLDRGGAEARAHERAG